MKMLRQSIIVSLLFLITNVTCQNTPCPICDDGSTLLNATKLVDIPEGYTSIKQASCDQINTFAKAGLLAPFVCEVLATEDFKKLCPCSVPESTNRTSTTTSDAPTSSECFVCGEGYTVGFPNKSIAIPPGYVIDSATCHQIEQLGAVGLIDDTYCSLVRSVVVEPNCTCVPVSDPEESPEDSPDDSACFICGKGNKVGNPNGKVSVPGGYSINSTSCYHVEQIGLIGLIPSAFCGLVRSHIKNSECDCIADATVEPSDAASDSPSDAASDMISDVPTSTPAPPTTKPFASPWKQPVRTPTWSKPVASPWKKPASTPTWSKPVAVRYAPYSYPKTPTSAQ
jgi:hypothetical protein